MTNQKYASHSKSEIIYQKILEMIDSSVFKPNEKLPSETILAIQLSVSRPILRQAIGRLRSEGRIYSKKGSGHYVRESSPEVSIVYGSLKNIADVKAFLIFRQSLESEVAFHAAKCTDKMLLKNIAKQCELMEKAISKNERFGINEDIQFHEAIAEASGNRFFIETIKAISHQSKFGIKLSRDLRTRSLQERFTEIFKEHLAISDAIQMHDSEAARQAMIAHHDGSIKRLFG